MAKEEGNVIPVQGEVIEAFPNAIFSIEVDMGGNKIFIRGRLSGKMRTHYIKVLPGDWVTVELSPYNLSQGRIITRHKPEEARLLAKAKSDKSIPSTES